MWVERLDDGKRLLVADAVAHWPAPGGVLLKCPSPTGLVYLGLDEVLDVSPLFMVGEAVDVGDVDPGVVTQVWPGLARGQSHVYEVVVAGGTEERLLVFEEDLAEWKPF